MTKQTTRLDDILLPYQKKFCNSTSSRKMFLKARQIGGSFCIAYCCVKKAATNPNSLSLILSSGERAAQELLKKCQQWCECAKVVTHGKLKWEANACEVRLSNGSRILSVPSGNLNAARGFTVTGVLAIDEAAYIENFEELWQSVVPTMTNRMRQIQPDLILASTPAAKTSLFGQLWFGNDDFEKFETDIYQAKADGLDVDIDELHKLIPDPVQFSVEFECAWSDSTNQLIDTGLIQWYLPTDEKYDDYFMGVDFGRHNDSTAIAIVGRDKYGMQNLCDLYILTNVEYARQIAVIKQVWNKYHPKCGYGDAGGLGSPLCEQLNKEMSVMFRGIQFSQGNKTDMYEYFRKSVFDRKFRVNEDFKSDIIKDINLIRQKISDSGKTMYLALRSGNSHADSMTAVILALHASRQNTASNVLPIFTSSYSAFGRRTTRL